MPGEEPDTTLRLGEASAPRGSRFCFAIHWVTTPEASTQLLVSNRMTIGRGAEADIRVDSAAVSREHTRLTFEGPALAIRDLGSRNGTFLNGRRIAHGVLAAGDVLRLGDAVGVVVHIDPNRVSDAGSELGGTLFGPDLSDALTQIRRAARSDLPIVIVGETGVGKECLARAVHFLSERAGVFHAIDCATLPSAHAETELFGYRRGAFSGAEQASVGHLRAADGGTLLLDELAELAPSVQAKLLRALQEKQVTPLGEVHPVAISSRIVATSQVPLPDLVQSKRLRQDLAARLSGLTVVIPPLRARRCDIALLFRHFLRRSSADRPPLVDSKLIEQLVLHDWPDNVRQLELLTARLVALHGDEPLLRVELLPELLQPDPNFQHVPRPSTVPTGVDRDEHDLRALEAELLVTSDNVSRASANIGISRQRAYRLLSRKPPSK